MNCLQGDTGYGGRDPHAMSLKAPSATSVRRRSHSRPPALRTPPLCKLQCDFGPTALSRSPHHSADALLLGGGAGINGWWAFKLVSNSGGPPFAPSNPQGSDRFETLQTLWYCFAWIGACSRSETVLDSSATVSAVMRLSASGDAAGVSSLSTSAGACSRSRGPPPAATSWGMA